MFLSWGSIFGGPSVVHVSCGSCKLTSAFKTNSACKQERIAESSRKILRLRVSFFLALETNGNFLLSDHPPPFPLCTPPTSRQYYCSKISFHLGCCHPSLVLWRSFWVSVFFFQTGFIAQLAQGKSTDECVRCGHYAANYMIRQSGVTLTQPPNFS